MFINDTRTTVMFLSYACCQRRQGTQDEGNAIESMEADHDEGCCRFQSNCCSCLVYTLEAINKANSAISASWVLGVCSCPSLSNYILCRVVSVDIVHSFFVFVPSLILNSLGHDIGEVCVCVCVCVCVRVCVYICI